MLLYAAYGSNLNKQQMMIRCPLSKPFSSIVLKVWRLVFKGVADIEKNTKHIVQLGLYKITQHCEKKLDNYEGYPKVYRKYYIYRNIKGKDLKIMFYGMEQKFSYASPTEKYYKVIDIGYKDWNFDRQYIFKAGNHSILCNSKNGYKSKNWKDKKYLNQEFMKKIKY